MTASSPSPQPEAPRLDLAYLRSTDARLDELAAAIQKNAVDDVVRTWSGGDSSLPKKALVTGSSGYLGAVLVRALAALGVEVVGLDRQPGPETTLVADICDALSVARAAMGCQAIFHTAALHAPNAPRFSEEDYIAVNVNGTENLWNAALANQTKVFIHTSTTSLMATSTVKDIESRGGLAFLGVEEGDAASSEEPRNKYGRSKLKAELLLEHGVSETSPGPAVVILRAPRFFPEDAFDSDHLAQTGTSKKSGTPENSGTWGLPGTSESPEVAEGASSSGARTKVVELLGTRTSLVDLLDAHLRAMALALRPENDRYFRRYLLTPPALLQRSEVSADPGGAEAAARQIFEKMFPEAALAFKSLGWKLPTALPRIYDGSLACRSVRTGGLGWIPKWDFHFLIRALRGSEGPNALDDARAGRF